MDTHLHATVFCYVQYFSACRTQILIFTYSEINCHYEIIYKQLDVPGAVGPVSRRVYDLRFIIEILRML